VYVVKHALVVCRLLEMTHDAAMQFGNILDLGFRPRDCNDCHAFSTCHCRLL